MNVARNTPGVVAVSMSWGFSEFPHEAAYNSAFTTPAGHTGITFLAASGDSGSQGGPEWPASAPNVVSVGGTTLIAAGSGQYQLELPWSGSSGGYSRYEAEPSYQRSVQNTGKRSTPDVSFDGDPNSGVNVYETSPITGLGSWEVVGGTSLGTPAWAAIIAIADQGRALHGQGSLNGSTQTLPTLYALPAADFHAVTVYTRRARLAAAATANTVTGRGTPNGALLVNGLVSSQLNVSLTTNSSALRWAARTSRTRAHRAPPGRTSPARSGESPRGRQATRQLRSLPAALKFVAFASRPVAFTSVSTRENRRSRTKVISHAQPSPSLPPSLRSTRAPLFDVGLLPGCAGRLLTFADHQRLRVECDHLDIVERCNGEGRRRR